MFIIFYYLMFFTCSTGSPFSTFYDTSSFSEPTFTIFNSDNSRTFVGIRTLRPSKSIFGFQQLKESLAKQAEQRRELRKTRELEEIKKQNNNKKVNEQLLLKQRQTRKTSNLQRRQRIYERLLCIATLQNLAQCRRNN